MDTLGHCSVINIVLKTCVAFCRSSPICARIAATVLTIVIGGVIVVVIIGKKFMMMTGKKYII